MEEKREYLVKGRILGKKFSRIGRILFILILLVLSMLINNAENAIFIIQNGERVDRLKDPESIYSTIGIILGDILLIKFSQIENMKKVTFVFFFLNGILYLIINSYFEIKRVLYIIRFFIFVLKDYKDFFIPAWIDQFYIKGSKTTFMYIYFTNMYGFILFLLVIDICLKKPNEVAIIFIIFGGLIIIFDCLLLFFPNKYFSYKYNFIGYKVKGKEEFTKLRNSRQSSFFENQEDKINNKEIGFLKTILNNKIYVFSILTNICYLFGFGELDIFNQKNYLFQCSHSDQIIGKFLGILSGGIKLICIGGYENKVSSIFLIVNSIIDFFFIFSYDLFFLYLFFFSTPLFIINKCVMVNCIPNKYKGPGLALSLLLENIIKFVGTIFSEFSIISFDNSYFPIKIKILLINILATIFFLLSSFYRIKNENENINEINNDKEKELEDIEKL